MAFFEWNDQYSVGVANVDEQHKKLVGYLNDLFEALNVGKGKEILDSILDNMVEYTQYHFATEEKLMKLHGYPGYDDHKKKHDKLAEHVLDLKSQYAAGNIVKVSPIQTHYGYGQTVWTFSEQQGGTIVPGRSDPNI